MPIKDLIGPGFIGNNTVEFIVTRGMGTAASTVQYYVESNHLISDVSEANKFRRGVAITGYTVALVNKTNGSAITSGTPTLKITKDGGTQGTVSGSATHEGNGQWSFNLTATETDASIIGLMITHTNAVPVQKTISTWE
tara:strand:- start:12524 stop:12940 length:417 start_codon:yes stop_codon:yes gene_type:complete